MLQTVFMTEGRLRGGSTSVNPNELIYTPSESVYALGMGGKLKEEREEAISIGFTLEDGQTCSITIRKGRARNISVDIENPDVAKLLASLEKPFTIFSPGLAGISKNEVFVSDGVLLRTIARGDANLVLRNILYRLWGTQEWNDFESDIHDVFPALEVRVLHDPKTDEFIKVEIQAEGEWVPIELAGTGILQSIQILSYIHQFKPSLIVLDEPDSHLHPNNQRLLCSLLRRIAEERSIQIVLTTHSRHVVDSLSNAAHLLWARDATIDVATQDDEIGILLDIGALDVKERVGVPGTKAVVLTEDENAHKVKVLFESSGFDASATAFLPYHGTTTIKNLRPLVQVIQKQNAKAKIVVHRDRDFLSDDDVLLWETNIRALGAEPFVTVGTDIESHFLAASYLAHCNGISDEEASDIVETVATNRHSKLVEAMVNGLVNVARQKGEQAKTNVGKLAAEAPGQLLANPPKYRHGKLMLAGVREEYRKRKHLALKDSLVHTSISFPGLMAIAARVFGIKPK